MSGGRRLQLDVDGKNLWQGVKGANHLRQRGGGHDDMKSMQRLWSEDRQCVCNEAKHGYWHGPVNDKDSRFGQCLVMFMRASWRDSGVNELSEHVALSPTL
jgi:hypothetical protein